MAFLSFTRCRPAEEPQVAADFQPREVVAKMTQCDTVVLSFTEGRMGRIEGLHRDVLIFTCQNPEKRILFENIVAVADTDFARDVIFQGLLPKSVSCVCDDWTVDSAMIAVCGDNDISSCQHAMLTSLRLESQKTVLMVGICEEKFKALSHVIQTKLQSSSQPSQHSAAAST